MGCAILTLDETTNGGLLEIMAWDIPFRYSIHNVNEQVYPFFVGGQTSWKPRKTPVTSPSLSPGTCITSCQSVNPVRMARLQ